MSFDPNSIQNFPLKPGVYLFKDALGIPLYIGKAKVLRKRVQQYFAPGQDQREMLPHLIAKVDHIDTIIVASEKEALILENNLIKHHQPRYNVLLKDDKGYVGLVIDNSSSWPKLSIGRKRDIANKQTRFFGPYTSARSARELLHFLEKLYPLRKCSDRELETRQRPCILYQMSRCIAPCADLCSKREYRDLVTQLESFLSGKDPSVLKQLYQEMHQASGDLDFEKAGSILETIRHLEQAIEVQNVDNTKIKSCDIVDIYREADEVGIALLSFRHGQLLEKESFRFSEVLETDSEVLTSFLLQHYSKREKSPRELVVGCQLEEQATLEEILSCKIAIPQRGQKKALLAMAHSNAKAALKSVPNKYQQIERALLDLQEKLLLENFPEKIDCIDTSNTAGSQHVAVAVTYTGGEKDRSGYRKYGIKSFAGGDDYAAMREVLQRRYERAKKEGTLPDLLIVDGGKGQLSVAVEVLTGLDISTIDIIGLAKEQGRHDKGLSMERAFLVGEKNPITFELNSPSLFLLQRIRDEAHRYAIGFHRQRRSKAFIASELDFLPGIGPVKRKRLLQTFGSVAKLKQTPLEEIAKVKGINQKDTLTISQWQKS